MRSLACGRADVCSGFDGDERPEAHLLIDPAHVLADDPETVASVKNGQRLDFARSEVTDWGYVLNGRQKGSFTVCVLFKHMPVSEVDQYRKDYGFEC